MIPCQTRRRWGGLSAAVAGMIAAMALCVPAGVEAQETERCATPQHRQFDFWLGRWEVRNADGEVVGHNEIREVAGGCGLLESWRGTGGGTGMSVNTYDADLDRWTQRWVGSGATLWLEGGLEEGPEGRRMVLAGTGPRSTPRGRVLDRIVWTPLPDGRVRQLWEVSSDGGETWGEAFVGFYGNLAPQGDDTARPPAPAADAEQIRRVVTSAYIDGLHRNGSRDSIRAGFHPAFVMQVLRDDGVTSVGIEEWIARLPSPGTPPGHTVSHRIPDVSISGRAAVARVEVMFDDRHVFTDYMSLYEFEEGWRIVAKIFHTEPR